MRKLVFFNLGMLIFGMIGIYYIDFLKISSPEEIRGKMMLFLMIGTVMNFLLALGANTNPIIGFSIGSYVWPIVYVIVHSFANGHFGPIIILIAYALIYSFIYARKPSPPS